ncbi:MAG TPA: hypothetical protein VFQ13_02660 [Anaerolineales bacterium]|nr:hypothetical protein [Anaerolineales bacterium]
MNLIDKYIAEVGKHLPRRNRADIEAEIRSTLEDMLDEHSEREQTQGPVDDAAVIELLKEYGAPRKVAESYVGPRYLIGPRMYPFFEMVTRIVFAVLIAVTVVGLVVGLVQSGASGPEFLKTLGNSALSLLGGLMSAFGNIVLVFAILERVLPKTDFEKEMEDWDPKELASEPDPDKLDLPDHIFSIIFTVLGLVILNLYPNIIAIRFENNGTWVSIPIFTQAFFQFLPWINIMGLLQILFNGFMLSQKEWTAPTRILSILMDIAQLVLLVAIMKTPGIFESIPEALTALGIREAADVLSQLFKFIPMLIIGVVTIVTVIKIVQSSLRLFKSGVRPPYPIIK